MWAYFAKRPSTHGPLQGENCYCHGALVNIKPDVLSEAKPNPWDYKGDRVLMVHRVEDLTDEEIAELKQMDIQNSQWQTNAMGIYLPQTVKIKGKFKVVLDFTTQTKETITGMNDTQTFTVVDNRVSISSITKNKVA